MHTEYMLKIFIVEPVGEIIDEMVSKFQIWIYVGQNNIKNILEAF